MSLKKRFLKYVLPTIASLWLFTLYTMVDGIFVGKGVGSAALSAVNIAMPYITFLFALATVIAVGASTIASMLLGSGDHEGANSVFTRAVAASIAASLIVTALAWFLPDQVAALLGASGENLPYFRQYIGMIVPFSFFFVVSYVLEIMVKTDGFPRLAAISIAVGGVTNLVLDWLFVFVLPYGIRGAAFATGISQIVSFTIFIVHFAGKRARLRPVRFKPGLSLWRRLVPLGTPAALIEGFAALVCLTMNRVLLRVAGESALVTHAVVYYVNTLVLMTMLGVAQGSQPITSFECGSGQRKSVLSLLRMQAITIAIIATAAILVCNLAGGSIVSAFIDRSETALLASSTAALRIYSVVYLFLGFNVITAGFFSAIGHSRTGLRLAITRGALNIVSPLVLSFIGMPYVWLSAALAELACLVLSLLALRSWQQDGCRLPEMQA